MRSRQFVENVNQVNADDRPVHDANPVRESCSNRNVTSGDRSRLVGKGCLFHVEVEANAVKAVPSAVGREPRDTLDARCHREGSRPQGRSDPVRNGRRPWHGPRRGQWTLRLYGPGALNVVGTDGDVFNRQTGTLQESIDTITVAGAITTSTRLVATVYPDPQTKDAKVYFQNLVITPSGELGKIDVGQVSNFRTVQNGILAIDMPDFYLAHTETTKPSDASQIHTNAMSAGEIYIPQGVLTLRFGGVDVDYTPAGGTALNTTAQSNEFQIDLGLPVVQGTSVIVNTVNSDAEANSTAGSPAFQDFATFLVTGRLNLFQANQIDGNTTSGLVPTQLVNSTPSSGLSPGGTYLISQGGAATGQIGDVRVGGSATNFTTFITEDPINVAAAEGQLDAKIANYYIGGQTQNVLLLAPSGARNVQFGLGMDNVTINANGISSLRANRDALDSTVTVSRSIQNILIGGDVENTLVNVGEAQDLFAFANTPPASAFVAGSGVFFGTPPPSIANPEVSPVSGRPEPFAQNGGTMQVRIAGSVINSIFSAGVDPDPTGLTGNGFGTPADLILPRSVINAKVEGNISNTSNSLVAPASTGRAFFAKKVQLIRGPVIPPTVPYQPYATPTKYNVGQNGLKGLFKIDHVPAVTQHDKAKKK